VIAQRDHFAAQLADELRERGGIFVAGLRLRDHFGQPALPFRARTGQLPARLLQVGFQRRRPPPLGFERAWFGPGVSGARQQRGEARPFRFQLGALRPGRLGQP